MSVTGQVDGGNMTAETAPAGSPKQGRPGASAVIVAVLLGLFLTTVIRLAWYGDDWLITLRTVLNAVHGNGLVYNVDERVAAYTHPLWMLLILGVGAISGSWVTAVIAVSVCLSLATAAILLVRTRTVTATLAIGTAMIVSNTVTVWSTGGLEGPLAGLLIVCFIAAAQWATTSRLRGMGWGLLAAGIYLTRADAMILIVPLMVYAAIRWRRAGLPSRWPISGLLMPVLAWSVFSWAYYGSVLPNTYAAKTNVAIPASELIDQGMFYLRYSVGFDPGVWVPLVLAVVAWLLTRSRVALMLAIGVLSYLAYVVWVGGDFMAGRFLYLPVIVALAAVAEASRLPKAWSGRVWQVSMVSAVVLLVLLGFTGSYAMTTNTNTLAVMGRGVVDERAFWVSAANTNMVGHRSGSPAISGMDPAAIERAADGWTAIGAASERAVLVDFAGIGLKGMQQGPSVHILDQSALTDRFLADQTFVPVAGPPSPLDPLFLSGPGWRVGHYVRPVPAGYLEALTWNDPDKVVDPELRRELRSLWQRIRP